MSNLEYLTDQVESDTTRTPEEKETSIHWDRTSELATVESYDRTIVRHLLQHPDFQPSILTVQGSSDRVTSRKKTPTEISEDDTIIGVYGKLPIGALKVMKSARSNNHQNQVVSH
jgi:hypothetical protein